jgi:hypothetical protein
MKTKEQIIKAFSGLLAVIVFAIVVIPLTIWFAISDINDEIKYGLPD